MSAVFLLSCMSPQNRYKVRAHYIKVFHPPEYVALKTMICNTHYEENLSVCQYTGRKYLMRHLTKQTKIHSYNVNISKVALQMF